MPQLNLDPWFLILAISWLTYTMILQPKKSHLIYPQMTLPMKTMKLLTQTHEPDH